MLSRILLCTLLSSICLFAVEENKDAAKISEAFGHLIGKNIDTLGISFDIDLVVKGLKDSASGKASPMSEEECIEAITAAQESAFKVRAEKNLKEAEAFLKENAKHQGIISVDAGKLQYKIDKAGNGALVESHSNPVIRYVGKYLDGTVFGQSKEDEVLSLDETIPGFSKGLIGMKEGEKRTLFIHPEYGYGIQGFLPPNSLLTFEIEIVKANAPKEEIANSLITEPSHQAPAPNLEASKIR